MGAEYGVAVTEILAKSDIFAVPMWDPSVDSVYELDLTDQRNLSLISYYQLLQESDAIQQEIAWTSVYATQKSVLTDLITQAAQVKKGGDMTLVCLFGEGASHAAVAYGAEYGSWSLNGYMYDGRILMADPYLNEFSPDACLYFKSSTLEWCVPKWGFSDRNEGDFIGFASNAISLLNQGGYFGGTVSDLQARSFIPILEVPAEAEAFTLHILGEEEDTALESTSLNWFSSVASAFTYRRAGLDELALGYEILPQSTNTVSYQISYENCMLTVSADQAQSIQLLSDGNISLNGENSTFEAGIVSEILTPWENMRFSGSGCSILSVQPEGDGVLLQSDCLEGMLISAEQEDVSYSRRITLPEDAADCTTAFVYALEEGGIGVMLDTDGDGTCETELPGKTVMPDNILYGDANEDGKVSLLDVVYMNRYCAKVLDLNADAKVNADCDLSGGINMVDILMVLQYIVRMIPELPVIVE